MQRSRTRRPSSGRGSRSDTPTLDAEDVRRARAETRRVLGGELEAKATDEFCVHVAVPRQPITLLESVAARAAPTGVSAVLELAAVKRPRARRRPAEAPRASREIAAALKRVAPGVAESEKAVALLLRQAEIRATRDAFYIEIGELRDEIERASTTAGRPAEHLRRIGIAAAPVQACWLNRTIRAESEATVLGDVAGDDRVELVDVPRPLVPEALGVTLEAAAAIRKGTHLTGAGVTVGVIDSEVALSHPALRGRVIHRRNYTQEPFGTPAAHGTAVAGIIAADNVESSGIAPGALIYNYKVLGTHTPVHGDDFAGALAFQHALEDGVRVVNCSWGIRPATDGRSRESRLADEAWQSGLTVVKSSGNNGPLTTPGDAEGVLTVGATALDGKAIASYSAHGPTVNGRQRPHVVAPGGELGAELTGLLVGGNTGDLGDAGTSFAAPHVTGLLALLLEREPELSPDDQRSRVVAAAKRLRGVPANAQGSGLVSPASVLP